MKYRHAPRFILPCVLLGLPVLVVHSTARADLQAGLIAAFPLDGTAMDTSAHLNHGVVVGAAPTPDRHGSIAGAMCFDGVDDEIVIADAPVFNFSHPITLAAWVKPSSNGFGGIVGQWGAGGLAGDAFQLYCANQSLHAALPKAPVAFATATAAVPTNTWSHVAFSFDGSNAVFHVNGQPAGESTVLGMGPVVNSIQPVRIGRMAISSTPSFFHGCMDDVRIYNRVLSATEMLEFVDAGPEGPTQEIVRLLDPVESNDDYFGISVSVDCPRIAVGSARTSASRLGAVFVYASIEGQTWMLEQEIVPPTPVNGMRFSGVALSGDTLAIAAVRETVSGFADAGAVYLYQRGVGAPPWQLVKKQTAAVPQTGGYFGSQLALEGDVLAVSETSPSTSSRLIRVYQRNQGGPENWGLVASPLGSLVNAANAASYGNALSLSGTELAVLQYSTGGSGTALGAAYVFAQNQGGADNWGQIAVLQHAALEFGASSLSLSGDTLAVDRRIIGGAATANHVALFSRNQGGANAWGLLKLVRAAIPLTADDFGFPVALSGPLLLAGAHWDDQGGTDSGAAYLFGQNQGGANNWGQLAKLKGSGNTALHDFAYAVDVDNDVVVIGAPSDNTPGSAYVFARAAPDQPFRIVQILRVGQERQVAFKTDQDNHYYVLRRGDTLAAIGNPVDLKMAPRGTNILQAVETSTTTGFYKVERVPVSAPVDSDGDGANDLLELDFQPYRSPLTAADASVIPPVFLDAVPEQTTNTSETVTGRAWPGTTVTIAGGSSVVSGQVSQVGTYAFNIPLRQNRMNRLFLSANGSAPVAVNITHDREPPTLYVDFPSTGSETIETSTTLAGRVGDVLSGALGLNVTINGQSAAVAIGLGQNGTFDKPNLALALGSNTFTIVATDALGNRTTRTHTVVRKVPGAYRMERVSGDAQFAAVHNLVPQPLTVRVIDGNGQPFADKLVDFQVTRSDGLVLPQPASTGVRRAQVRTDTNGLARVYWQLGGSAGCATDRLVASSPGVDGAATFCATAIPGAASQINIGSGNNQVAETGAPAPQPLIAWLSDRANALAGMPVTFTVTEGNGTVNGQSSVTVNTGPTGHAEVQFRLASDGTRNAVAATFAGNPGLPATFTAIGRIRNALQPAVFRGLVLDNANQPLGGAQVWAYVNGQAFPTVNTDAQGFFELTDLPAGAGSLFVDGAFASQLNGQAIPLGSFPALSYEVVVTANTVNELPTPVRLPRLDPANSVVFNNSQDVTLRCAGIEGLELKVKAGSMRKADGSLVSPGNLAILSLNQVHTDEIPMPMPNGLAPSFAWTLQPGGATFNPPIQITIPNLEGLAPGAITDILTYNHALEQFQIVSTGQVSENGQFIVSDPGSGLSFAGWGAAAPPPPPPEKLEKECESCPEALTIHPITDPDALAFENGSTVVWTSSDPAVQANLNQLQARLTVFGCLLSINNASYRITSAYRPQSYQDHLYNIKQAYVASTKLDPDCRDACEEAIAEISRECGKHGVCQNPVASQSNHRLGNAVDISKSVGNLSQAQVVALAQQAGLSVLVESRAYHLEVSGPAGSCSAERLHEGNIHADMEESIADAEGAGDGPDPEIPEWTIALGGQATRAPFLESFALGNISVRDQFGFSGPGSAPDGLADVWTRLVAVQNIGGTNRYAYTSAFQIPIGTPWTITNNQLTFSDTPPPTLATLRLTVSPSVLTSLGQTVQSTALGTYNDGSTAQLEGPGRFTAWRSSNSAIVTVNANGMVTAVREGSAFITSINEAVAAVHRIEVRPGVGTAVVEGYVRTADGQPAVGALVNTASVPGDITSQTGGKFTFPAVPLDVTNLVFNATHVSGGSNLFGSATITGVLRPGTNDAGVVVVATPTAPAGLALIPAGEFQMGDSFAEGGSDERPVHPVFVSAFLMDRTEVTKAHWDEVRTWALGNGYAFDNAGLGKATNHPVHTVNWYDVVKWCNARSQKEGLTPCYYTDAGFTTVYKTGNVSPQVNWAAGGYRLPTEAEWEKAARGGLAEQRFPWGANITHAQANYFSISSYAYDTSSTRNFHPTYATGGKPYTSPVASFAPNGYGLHDMAGNLWEWNWDWSQSDYYATSPGMDPRGPTVGSAKVVRGGSWDSDCCNADGLRLSNKQANNPYSQIYNHLGFRCAR